MGMGVVLCALACTSVRMVQRDGCWLKQTETTLGNSREELGFCAKPEAPMAEDRMSRMVQACMAQADYRWQNRAIAMWGRGEPIPTQDSDDALAKTCMSQASAALGIEMENNALRSRLAELSQDREALKSAAEKDRDFLQQSSDKMVTALGEAAKKTMPNVTATATSTGTAKSDTPAQAPPTTVLAPSPVVVTMPAPAAAPVAAAVPAVKAAPHRAAAAPPACGVKRAPKLAKDAAAPDCEKPAQTDTAAAAVPPKAG
jgi:hypothetical protein